jgi:hypothetical protein
MSDRRCALISAEAGATAVSAIAVAASQWNVFTFSLPGKRSAERRPAAEKVAGPD